MPVTLGLLLSKHNARARRAPDPRIGVVLLERTLLDPPRVAAAKRWAEQLRRSFPAARLIPYTWHLVSHGPEEHMNQRTSRSLSGPADHFGNLQRSPQTAQAWEVTRHCAEALGSKAIAVRTPPSLTPGALGRSRVRSFGEDRRKEGLTMVWEPEGLWEPAIAAMTAREVGASLLLPAFAGGRPLRNEHGVGLAVPNAWLRVDGSGPRQGIHGGHVDELLDHADAFADTVMVFAGPRARGNLALVGDALGL